MDRFYNRAIELVEKLISREVSKDIKAYVNHLEFINSLLVSELAHSNTVRGTHLLERLGYKPEPKS